MTGHRRSLAEVTSDEVVTVRRILFECIRARCAELGVEEGDFVRVGDDGARTLTLRRPDGRIVRCPQELARFVEVQDDPGH